MAEKITCPKCQTEISIDAVLSQKIEADLQAKFAGERKQLELKWQQAQEKFKAEQAELAAAQKLVQEREQSVAAQVEAKAATLVAKEKTALEQQLKKELTDKIAAENQKERDLLTEQLQEQKQKLDQAQEMELKLRKERTQLEEAQKSFELEVQRKLDEERKTIAAKASAEAVAEQHLKLAELQKQLQDAQKANGELTRKLQQGSQQNQGEVLELELEELLRGTFVSDEVTPVGKGVNGADVEQVVQDRFGGRAGKIIWELKQTKAFSEGWVTKLKEDQRQAKAEMAVLVTTVLPKVVAAGGGGFGFYQGIWVTSVAAALPLATALRMQLLGLAGVRAAAEGKDEKMEALYQYITGVQFRQRIEAIVESFTVMQADLQKERTAYQRIWDKREKQIAQVIGNTVGLYGNLEGLVGKNLPELRGAGWELEEMGEVEGAGGEVKVMGVAELAPATQEAAGRQEGLLGGE